MDCARARKGMEPMAEDREIEAMLRGMAADEAPLPPGLRAAIVADAGEVAAARTGPRRWRWLAGWGPVVGAPAAALCGLWLGIAQPTLVLEAIPGIDATEAGDALLSDIYGSDWEAWI